MQISLGGTAVVQATEKFYDEIRRGRAFIGTTTAAAVAGEYAHCQLLNPVGSGVNAVVYAIEFGNANGGLSRLARYDTALATDDGAVINLLAGGAAGQCHVRSGSNAALLGTKWRDFHLVAAAARMVAESWFCELGPGEGITLAYQSTNNAPVATFLLIELPQ